jgi:hypothetical protein
LLKWFVNLSAIFLRSLVQVKSRGSSGLVNGDRVRDERYMKMALEEATRAGETGEVPVGAVLVKGDRV